MKVERRRLCAWVLLAVMVTDMVRPTVAMALTTGPGQPEVEGFTPIGNTDMVDLFSGDFSYNIPIMDVEGYPINLAYQAGGGMEQEASWVGFGWSLNPGVVERGLRGLPDDFAGDGLTRQMHLRPNTTVGGSLAADLELWAIPILGETNILGETEVLGESVGALGVSLGINFNNYEGSSFSLGITPSMRATMAGKGTMNAGLGLSSSSHDGMRVQPMLSYDWADGTSMRRNNWRLGFGMTMDSRQGLTNMSFNASAPRVQKSNKVTKTMMSRMRNTGASVANFFSGRLGASFDLGSQTYTPQVTMPYKNSSFTGSFKFGGDIGGAFASPCLSGFYSIQELMTGSITTPAYGYLNLSGASPGSNVQLDFNREKDGPYSSDQTSLPIAQVTNDVFSVSGQNMSGSYVAQRNEIGHVFDPRGSNVGSGKNIGIELGPGNPMHWGIDAVVNSVNSQSGDWTSNNIAGGMLRYKGTPGPLGESVFFKEANELPVELDDHLYSSLGGDAPARPAFSDHGAYDQLVGGHLISNAGQHPIPSTTYRVERQPRSQVFSYLSHAQMAAGLGTERLPFVGEGEQPGDNVSDRSTYGGSIKPHHMSEVTVTGADGTRNVYGIAAYNIEQKDVSFAIGRNWADLVNHPTVREVTTAYEYDPSIVYTGAPDSKDQYSSVETVPAYAHSFLLTAALSADYSDIDDVKGPSTGDLGSYTRFSYALVDSSFHWRTPIPTGGTTNVGRVDHGQLAITDDDKLSFSYGRKEVWLLDRISSRNMCAIFYTSERKDGLGVGESGNIIPEDKSLRLDSIALFTWQELDGPNPVPIKTAHFDYYSPSQSICPGIPNAIGEPNTGKLTLKEVYFTYGKSQRGRTSPYVFKYHDNDTQLNNGIGPGYNANHTDRWGQYKPVSSSDLPNNSFPYAEQDTLLANEYARAWSLEKIVLPSGGTIQVTLESDDYGWVQNKDAMRMFKVSGMTLDTTVMPDASSGQLLNDELSAGSTNVYLILDIPEDLVGLRVDSFVKDLDLIYFRFKVEMDRIGGDGDELDFDYVSGYAKLDWARVLESDNTKLCVALHKAPLDGDGEHGPGNHFTPMYRAAMDQLRLQYPKQAYQPTNFDENDSFCEELLVNVADATWGMIEGIGEFFLGPNAALRGENRDFCNTAVFPDCWIRLREPDRTKEGGGYRVRQITFSDSWMDMVPGAAPANMTYTQVYDYTTPWGTSSGVAAYEPMFGADENPWRKPVFYANEIKLSPDERFYQEEPFGESMFPGPSIGYSRVTVRDAYPDPSYAASQGTGRVVNEFYTAKDFPVILGRTGIEQQRRRSTFSLLSITGVKMTDKNHTAQGFTIETNDMHGKPKRTTVYPQEQEGMASQAVSHVTYEYQDIGYGSAQRLTNQAKVIHPDGSVAPATIGRHYEFFGDMREFRSESTSGGLALNTETVFVILGAFPIPIPLPKYSQESTAYRSATFVKKIHRFGLLERVEKMENGSVVSTENMAYDARTGAVLLTKTQNDFEDPVYSMQFPAYWYYDGMGPAYRNIGAHLEGLSLSIEGMVGVANAQELFFPGDELVAQQGTNAPVKAWIDETTASSIRIIRTDGGPLTGGNWNIRVLRSGRRNMLSTNMMSLTTLTDPLEGLQANVFANVLQAQTVEMGHPWRGNCSCHEDEEGEPIADMSNAWRYNRKGVWRLTKEHAWLTERSRGILNNNTNIRRDGVFSTFDPFYKLNYGNWQKEPTGWTMVREVTEYSDRGQELENKDALGLYSSATFGYGGSLPTAVARNARYSEVLTENFENGTGEEDCSERRWEFHTQGGLVQQNIAHTGRYSLRASTGAPPYISAILSSCPDQGCDLQLRLNLGQVASFTASAGTAPYTFDYDVLLGDVTLTPAGETTVELSGLAPLIVRVTVTDANGCTATQTWNDQP